MKEIFLRRELLFNLIIRNLKIRYKGSVLGFFWSFLDPLLMMLVYLVFIKLMRFSIELPVLLVGVIAWQFFIMCVHDSTGVITGNTNLVKKVYFPKMILPLAIVSANLVNFLLSIFVLVIILFLCGIHMGTTLVLFPIVAFSQSMLCLGLSLIVSSLNVFFRDIEHFVSVILMTWFFITPIIYPLSKVPEKYYNVYFLNPMAWIISAYRYIFLGGVLPAASTLYFSLTVILSVFVIGWSLFSHLEKYFADEL